MLIHNFDVRKLIGAVWDEAKLDFEDCEDPITEIKPRLDFWTVAGLEAPDEDEHNEDKEQKF